MFPLHTWLPDAHVEAPTPGSVILAAVLLKMGTYGFVRFLLPLFPEASQHPTVVMIMLVLGVIGIIYAAWVAAIQPDAKKLVAYTSVAHMGFVVIGVFALTVNGLQGGLLVMISHGISTGALFLLLGMLYERRHTRQIADFGGLGRVAPLCCDRICHHGPGLDRSAGYKWICRRVPGAFGGVRNASRDWGHRRDGCDLRCVLYAAHGAARLLQHAGRRREPQVQDLSSREIWVLSPLLAAMILVGVHPPRFSSGWSQRSELC